jgi:hypothetical protein
MVLYDNISLIPILTKHNTLFEALFLNNQILIFLCVQLTWPENIESWLGSSILHFHKTIV